MDKISEYLYENKLRVPARLLIHTHSQLKFILISKRVSKSWEGISVFLTNYYYNEFKEKYPDILDIYNIIGIGLSASSIERAIKGEKGKAKYPVKYELLDFICYVTWDQSLASKIFNNDEDWGKEIMYDLTIPNTAEPEIENLKKNHLSVNTKSHNLLFGRRLYKS